MNSMLLLIIIGALCSVWFTLPVFTGRIINIGNLTGFAIGILLILIGLFAQQIGKLLVSGWQIIGVRIVLCIVGAAVAVIACLAVMTAGMMIYGCNRAPQADATVVVLGCRVYGTKPSIMLTERLDKAYDYLNKHPEAKCILSGGQGDDEGAAEAEVMYSYLVDRGIASDRLYVENKSTSTRENLKFSYEIIKREGLNENLAIITNEFHEYRAYRIAKALNLSCGAVPAGTAWWLFPTFIIREMYGILYEYVF